MLRFPALFLVGLLGTLAALAILAINFAPSTTTSVVADVPAAATPVAALPIEQAAAIYEIHLDGAYNNPGSDPHIKFSGGCLVTGSSDYSTIEGTTPKRYGVTGIGMSCTFQKQGANNFHLQATVLRDGELVKQIETTAEYGIVSFAI
jgi:hypothetical protein